MTDAATTAIGGCAATILATASGIDHAVASDALTLFATVGGQVREVLVCSRRAQRVVVHRAAAEALARDVDAASDSRGRGRMEGDDATFSAVPRRCRDRACSGDGQSGVLRNAHDLGLGGSAISILGASATRINLQLVARHAGDIDKLISARAA